MVESTECEVTVVTLDGKPYRKSAESGWQAGIGDENARYWMPLNSIPLCHALDDIARRERERQALADALREPVSDTVALWMALQDTNRQRTSEAFSEIKVPLYVTQSTLDHLKALCGL